MSKPIIRLVWIMAISILLSACQEDAETIAYIDGEPILLESFERYLLYQRNNNVFPDDIALNKSKFIDSEALAQAISKTGMVDEVAIDLELDAIRKKLLLDRYLERYLKESITEQSIHAFYEKSENQHQIREAHVAHLLLHVDKKESSEERRIRYELAQSLYGELKNGANFDQLVQKYSDDMLTKHKGGSLGWVREGVISQSFSKAVFDELPVGEISKPIQSQFGIHIVKLLEPLAYKAKPFKEVRAAIEKRALEALKADEIDRLLSTVVVIAP